MTPLILLGVVLMIISALGVPGVFWLWRVSGNWFDIKAFYCLSGGFAALGIAGILAFSIGLLIKR